MILDEIVSLLISICKKAIAGEHTPYQKKVASYINSFGIDVLYIPDKEQRVFMVSNPGNFHGAGRKRVGFRVTAVLCIYTYRSGNHFISPGTNYD